MTMIVFSGGQVLIHEGKAPILPRTDKLETPEDIARAADQMEFAEMIANWPIERPISDRKMWLHGKEVGRKEAVKLLNENPEIGTFLVRESQKKEKTLVLSLYGTQEVEGTFTNRTLHFEISAIGTHLFMDLGPYMPSLEHLVDHYMTFKDGLPCRLIRPVHPL